MKYDHIKKGEKMKKLSLVLCAGVALAACSFDPNLDSAAETRKEHLQERQELVGCGFTDDHASYRKCVLNTYAQGKPKTYEVDRTDDGRAIAVIRDATTTSYDKEKDAYKTERIIVIETEERLVPMDQAISEAETATQTTTEKTADATITTTTTTAEQTTEAVAPAPTQAPVKESWWDSYQRQKDTVKVSDKPICPCSDPNDPCPQCYDK